MFEILIHAIFCSLYDNHQGATFYKPDKIIWTMNVLKVIIPNLLQQHFFKNIGYFYKQLEIHKINNSLSLD